MIIQCPHCQTRCKIRTPEAVSRQAHGRCPKCHKGFLLAETAAPEQASPRQFLVVDDSPFFQEMIRDIVGSRAECRVADSVAAAWPLLEQARPDLLIVDINMPGEKGTELIQKVRRHKRLHSLPILAISSVYRREQDQTRVLRAGADAFINKSFRPEEFLQQVEALLEKAPS